MFHTNIGSLSKHKDELEAVLSILNFDFDVIGLTETKLNKVRKSRSRPFLSDIDQLWARASVVWIDNTQI